MSHPIFTVGHSNRTIEDFCALLRAHRISAIADVRSQPFSHLHPQFNRELLRQHLQREGLAYSLLGQELGARSSDASCYLYGRVQYDRLAESPAFRIGLQRLLAGRQTFQLAVLCSEREPLLCHRSILIARCLVTSGVSVLHILDSHEVQTHQDLEEELLRRFSLDAPDLFRPRSERMAQAYRLQEERIAYEQPRAPVEAEA